MSYEYIAVYEADEGGWTASVPDLPGCFSDASSLSQAQTSIREAIRHWIDTAKAKGWEIPPPQAQVEKIAV